MWQPQQLCNASSHCCSAAVWQAGAEPAEGKFDAVTKQSLIVCATQGQESTQSTSKQQQAAKQQDTCAGILRLVAYRCWLASWRPSLGLQLVACRNRGRALSPLLLELRRHRCRCRSLKLMRGVGRRSWGMRVALLGLTQSELQQWLGNTVLDAGIGLLLIQAEPMPVSALREETARTVLLASGAHRGAASGGAANSGPGHGVSSICSISGSHAIAAFGFHANPI